MKILVSSWQAVSAQTIVNCFRKAGITPEAQNAAITDVDDLFSDLKESLQQLHDTGEEMSLVINKFEKLFIEDRIASKKQTNICDFFKPVRL